MQFTVEQYNEAIEALEMARDQTAKRKQYQGCSICGGIEIEEQTLIQISNKCFLPEIETYERG